MRGCVGNSENEATRRWNWASDLTSFSSGREDSRTKFRIRGSLSWIVRSSQRWHELRRDKGYVNHVTYGVRQAAQMGQIWIFGDDIHA